MRAGNHKIEELDLFVWEGTADILERVMRCMGSLDVEVIRADDMTMPPERDASRATLAIISVSVIDKGSRMLHAWQAKSGMPVIWVGAVPRERVFSPRTALTIWWWRSPA